MKFIKTFEKFWNFLRKKKVLKNELDTKIDSIIKFLNSNSIYTLKDVNKLNLAQKEWLKNIIKSFSDNEEDMKNLFFCLEVKLSDKKDLEKLLKSYLKDEEYEKCNIINQKIKKLNIL